jgi:hypothetical protein
MQPSSVSGEAKRSSLSLESNSDFDMNISFLTQPGVSK